ncbi:MAG: class I tRNA ligase family protein, partial [Patescibacteria group bacterium]
MEKPVFQPVDPKASFPKLEHEILSFWEKEKIFEKSVENRKGKPKFVFFDGPPFANGLPHYGHILANALKDAVTRYWTMQGHYVPRVNGWDCHGLPVEYEIEKELKISGRKDIEKMGVSKFNAECRKSVFRYTEEWEKLLKRIGRWVDFENSYATLDNNYIESIWWVFKEIWKKKLVYRGYKPMHVCPRCETSLSNFEVTLGYKDVVDLSITMKFELVDEPNTYFLAWTTTPWSSLSVTGLAIGPDFDYVKVRTEDGAQYYLAAARAEAIFKGLGTYEVVRELKGKDLVHKPYKHLFDFYNDHPEIKKSKWAFHTVPADYVSTEDGTGIVTINGAFGEIDFESAQKHGLPILVNVSSDGHFTKDHGAFSGMYVKEAEPKIAEDLKKRGLLLRKDPVKHSYPHCWRCDTPLLNYATQSWFIRVTDVKEKLIKNNSKIHWTPEHIKEGRFGKWLENAKDWNISRNRFWGCPIPIWHCECGGQRCLGSLKELRENSVGGNTFFVVRHGEAEQNVAKKLNSNPRAEFHLTKEGTQQVKKAAEKVKTKGADLIFCSQFPRAEETAEIFSQTLGAPVTVDNRLREHEMGVFDGKDTESYVRSFADLEERYYRKVKGGESFEEMEERVIEFINYLNRKYTGKKIVIVTHGDVIRAIARYFDRLSIEDTFKFKPDLAAVYEYRAGNLPLRDGKLDLHKPYIDEIEITCEDCGKPMKRIPEVLDCWFESGSMPYAQLHYPFENKKEFEENFPANFIAEGVDQTRGWFYTLHVIATILFNKPAFNNVIVNGILLAADGEKLSKRKKNYPDPSKLFETYGVDSTRFFLYASTAPLAQDVRFSEKHVEEIVKKFTLTLWNTYSFFVTYANIDGWRTSDYTATSSALRAHSAAAKAACRVIEGEASAQAEGASGSASATKAERNKLDEWIISELNVLIQQVTDNMNEYNLTEATRPIMALPTGISMMRQRS